MNEEQRLSYLKNMGYQVYYPRAILPGAKPSPKYDLPESREAKSVIPSTGIKSKVDSLQAPRSGQKQTKNQSNISTGKSESAIVEEVRGKASDKERVKRKSQSSEPAIVDSPPKAVSTSTDQAEQLKFSLQYYAINDRLAVINEEPHQLQGRDNKDCLTLLAAILNALMPGFDKSLNAESFEWPIAEGLSAAEPERAAQLALNGFINQRQSQEGFPNLLIFTAQLGRLFNEKTPEDPFGEAENSALHCQLTVTHSLHSILAHPLLKKEVWSHLQSLRHRLQA